MLRTKQRRLKYVIYKQALGLPISQPWQLFTSFLRNYKQYQQSLYWQRHRWGQGHWLTEGVNCFFFSYLDTIATFCFRDGFSLLIWRLVKKGKWSTNVCDYCFINDCFKDSARPHFWSRRTHTSHQSASSVCTTCLQTINFLSTTHTVRMFSIYFFFVPFLPDKTF